METQVQFVTVTKKFSKKGIVTYEYWANFKDESHPKELVRSSLRIFQKAFQYSQDVKGSNGKGLKRFFTFGKAPDRYSKDSLINVYQIDSSKL